MKTLIGTMLLGLAFVPCALHATSASQIRVTHAWLRILPGDLPAGGYAMLQNLGKQPVELTGARSKTYAQVILHVSSLAGGTSRMRMVDAMQIPANGVAQLAPGGYHLMLTQPIKPVLPGDHVLLTLTFADGSATIATFLARPANAMDAGPGNVAHAAARASPTRASPNVHHDEHHDEHQPI